MESTTDMPRSKEIDEILKSWEPFDFEKVKELVEAGANINQETDKKTLLSKAVRNKCDLACCKWLIERSSVATINCVDDYGYTPLYKAIRDKRLALAKLLIQHGANVNTLTKDGDDSPLHHACEYSGYLDFVKLLVEEGNASLTTVDVFGRTPLFVASLEGRFGIVKYLLDHDDADASSINIMDEDGRTPFMIAQQKGYTDIANLLKGRIDPKNKLKSDNARQKKEQEEEKKKHDQERELQQKERQQEEVQNVQKLEQTNVQQHVYFDGKPILSADELQLVLEFVNNKITSFSNPVKNMDQFWKMTNVAKMLVQVEKNGYLPSLKHLEDEAEKSKKELKDSDEVHHHDFEIVHGDDEAAGGSFKVSFVDGQTQEQAKEKLDILFGIYEDAKQSFEQRRIALERM